MKKLFERCRWALVLCLCLGMAAEVKAAIEPTRTWSHYSDLLYSPYYWDMRSSDSLTLPPAKMTYVMMSANNISESECHLVQVSSVTNACSVSVKGTRNSGRLVVDEYNGDPRNGATKIGSMVIAATTETKSYDYTFSAIARSGTTVWLVLSWEASSPAFGVTYDNTLNISLGKAGTGGGGSGGSGGSSGGVTDPDVYISWHYHLLSTTTAEVTGVDPNPWGNAHLSTGVSVIPAMASDTVRVTAIGDGVFSGYSGLLAVTIPSAVTRIGDRAFSGCSGLTALTLSSALKTIGESAFADCNGIKGTLVIPSGVTAIGGAAFSGCSGLTGRLTIPNGVESIEPSTFSSCSGLTDVSIPLGVTGIGAYAFSGCSGLTGITIPGSVTNIGDWAFFNCEGLMSVDVRTGVVGIGEAAFKKCSALSSLTISSSVTEIGRNAFQDCSGLTSVTIPQYVCEAGLSSVFPAAYGSIKHVTIVEGATEVLNGTFKECVGIESISIPATVTNIVSGAFSNCSRLKSISVASGNPSYKIDSAGRLVTKDGKVVIWDPSHGGGHTEIPPGETSISVETYSGNTNLTSVTIPSSVTNIEDGAFAGCSGLTDVTVPQYVCDRGFSSIFPDAYRGMQSVVVAEGTTDISMNSFEGCNSLEWVVIPASVTNIGYMAFRSVTNSNLRVFILGNPTIANVQPSDAHIGHIENDGYTTYVTDAWKQDVPDGYVRTRITPSIQYDEVLNVSSKKLSMKMEGDAFVKSAELHYTTDGSAPTKDSPVFSPFSLAPTVTVTVGAFLNDYCVLTSRSLYWKGNVAKPVIAANTSDSNTWTVVISCATKDAAVHYTTDGTVPTAGSAQYGTPFTISPAVNGSITIRAKAFKTDWKDAEATAVTIRRLPVPEDGLGGTVSGMGGAAAWSWTKKDGVESLRSGEIGDSQESWFETIVTNKGTVSFKWKASCEKSDSGTPWDHAEFLVDGVIVKRLDGQTGWIDVTHTITNQGVHTLRWVYKKDASDKSGEDCAWVAQFNWEPAASPSPTPGPEPTPTPGPEPTPTPGPEPTPTPGPGPTPEVFWSGEFDTSFAKAQTVTSALYSDGDIVGTVEVKAARINRSRWTVRVSASATLIVGGRAKKFTAKAINLPLSKGGTLSGTLVFKSPIGEMSFDMDADGKFTLENSLYVAKDAVVGGKWVRNDANVYVEDMADIPAGTIVDLLPDGEPVIPKGGKWSFNKNATVKLSKDKTTYTIDDKNGKTNRSSMKLTYTPKTGVFKGSFKLYALEGVDGKKKLKKYTVNVIGFVVDGKGIGEATCKKPNGGPWPVTVD